MKLGINAAILMSGLLSSALVVAECTSNRNNGIAITKPDNLYIDHDDGTVSDKNTGLMWQKCSLGLSGNQCDAGVVVTLTWQAALAAANDNTNSGYVDWRLPNKNELESLLEGACYSPAINETVFPNTSITSYWSSSVPSGASNYALYVNFYGGVVNVISKNRSWYVRLVRGK